MGQKVKVQYTRLWYAIDVVCSFLNRWRYAFILWTERVLVRRQHDRHAEYVASRYDAMIKKEIHQDRYVIADRRYFYTWGGTWRPVQMDRRQA